MEYLNSNTFSHKGEGCRSPSHVATLSVERSDENSMIQDQVRAMFQVESEYNSQYVVETQCSAAEREQHSEWRGKICEWCYRVIDHYQYDREVVSIAMDYFDRFIFKQDHHMCKDFIKGEGNSTPSQTYQLAAMTSLYIAIKLHAEVGIDSCEFNIRSDQPQTSQVDHVQPYNKAALRLQSYVKLSRGQFNEHDILRVEEQILFSLNWKVNPVTPMCFVSYMIRLIPPCRTLSHTPQFAIVLHVLHELSRYLTELAICLPNINMAVKPIVGKKLGATARAFSPSSIAYASILVSIDLITVDAFPISMRQRFVAKVSEIAFEASSFSHDEYLFFNPTSRQIQVLKSLIRDSFRPEDVLQGAAEGGEECLQHPITIAKLSGFLNIQSTREDGVRKTYQRCGTPINRSTENNREDNGRSPTCVSRVARFGSQSKKFFRFSR